ncbi:MAG: DUF5686 family protein [Bacteroidota bacterium]
MNHWRKILFSWLLIGMTCSSFSLLSAQTRITGQVVDAISLEPLAFATIVYDPARKQGTTTDIQGRFELLLPEYLPQLVISYLGYEAQTLDPRTLDLTQPFEILLAPSEVSLEEVLIAVDQNPALRLIRKAVALRKTNDPERLPSYQCRIYNKLFFDWYFSPATLKAKQDSLRQGYRRVSEKQGLSVMESTSIRRHRAPDRTEQEVVGTRISGFQQPDLATLATDFQPFSFYQAQISLLDKSYRNPISPGSWRHYAFRLEDQWLQESDTVFLISFSPKERNNHDALRGQLFLNSQGYALQSVIAEPAQQGPLEFRLEQLYRQLPEGPWFPAQLNVFMRAAQYPSKAVGMEIEGKSWIDAVEVNVPKDSLTFRGETTWLRPLAAEQSEEFWEKYRPETLTTREATTYQWMDSLGKENDFDGTLDLAANLLAGRWGFRYVDLSLARLWLNNEYEGNRVEVNLLTNEDISQRFQLGGYLAYGFRDRAWKYGGQFQLNWWEKKAGLLRVVAQQDVAEMGRSLLEDPNQINLRSFQITRFDSVAQLRVSNFLRLRPGLEVEVGWLQGQRSPTYAYRLLQPDGSVQLNREPFQQREWQLGIRLAFREQVVESLGQRISDGSRYPIIRLRAVGSDTRWGSDFAYQKAEVEISQTLRTRQLGQTDLRLRLGQQWGDPIPMSLLFNGGGAYGQDQFLLVPGYFQTMRLQEFFSDRYVQALLTHDFGGRLLKIRNWQPRIKLVQGVAWGQLGQANLHQTSFQTLEQGYHESGLILDQLLRFTYLKLLYVGVGAGVFYRYGPYELPTWQENVALKIALSASIN